VSPGASIWRKLGLVFIGNFCWRVINGFHDVFHLKTYGSQPTEGAIAPKVVRLVNLVHWVISSHWVQAVGFTIFHSWPMLCKLDGVYGAWLAAIDLTSAWRKNGRHVDAVMLFFLTLGFEALLFVNMFFVSVPLLIMGGDFTFMDYIYGKRDPNGYWVNLAGGLLLVGLPLLFDPCENVAASRKLVNRVSSKVKNSVDYYCVSTEFFVFTSALLHGAAFAECCFIKGKRRK